MMPTIRTVLLAEDNANDVELDAVMVLGQFWAVINQVPAGSRE